MLLSTQCRFGARVALKKHGAVQIMSYCTGPQAYVLHGRAKLHEIWSMGVYCKHVYRFYAACGRESYNAGAPCMHQCTFLTMKF